MAMTLLSKMTRRNFCDTICCDNISICMPIFIVLFLGCLATFITGIVVLSSQPVSPSNIGTISLMMSIPVVLVLPYGCFLLQPFLRNRKIRKAVVILNQHLMKYRILAGFQKRTLCAAWRMKVTFWYYNVEACRESLTQHVMSLNTLSQEDTIQRTVETLIVKYSQSYTTDYLEGRLKYTTSFQPRHVGHVICLCQYIEDKLQSGSEVTIAQNTGEQ